jgi:hypothetical protein
VKECKKFNNFFAKTIEFFFRSDRAQSIAYIREFGTDRYAAAMTEKERMSFPKKKKR